MWEYNYYNPDVLCHYGVPGMKWGHRKAQSYSDSYNKVKNTKAAYKAAKKTYTKDYNKAYNYSARHPVSQWSSKSGNKAEADRRWDKAIDSAKKQDSAKRAYKNAKKANREAISKTQRERHKQASLGEKFMYNEATRRKAAKYVVNNNMSISEANKKAKGEAMRNTAILLGAYGIAVAGKAIYDNVR